MNRIILLLVYIFLTCVSVSVIAQVSLPYYSGFDNVSQRAGWQIYRTGESALANWSAPPFGGFSPTYCISHDYAPSSGAVLADDWYVSPGFLIPAGGSLDSIRYFFSGFSVPADDDTIGIFLLTGSQNPVLATSIFLLADFRGDEYQPDAIYRKLPAVSLPATQETAYIAIRYRNAQVSSRWLTVQFDNVAISGFTTSLNAISKELITAIYPNPCSTVLNIQHSSDAGIIQLIDQSGRIIQQINFILGLQQTSLSAEDLAVGTYYISLQQNGSVCTKPFFRR